MSGRRSGSTRLAAALALGAMALAACDSEHGLQPAPRGDEVVDDRPDPSPAAAPVALERRMLMRSPMGGPPGDLLVDGDFEFSVTVAGHSFQTGWPRAC
jgi:hypothetical protein